MILLAGEGLTNKEIARRLGQYPGKVGRWRKRYAESGLRGILKDKTRPGRIPALDRTQPGLPLKVKRGREKPDNMRSA